MSNEIDKLDGMIKIKGKCGYEIIGGCRELRKLKVKLEQIKTLCHEAPAIDSELSLRILEVIEGEGE